MLRKIGNSQGFVIPKLLLAQVGFENGEAEIRVEGDALVLSKRSKPTLARKGWAEDAKKIADAQDDKLVMGNFGNEEDKTWTW